MTWGKHLAQLRKHRGWSQQECAEHLGVTRQTLIALEKGQHLPGLELAMRIAAQFNMSLDELVRPLKSLDLTGARWLGLNAPPDHPVCVVWSQVGEHLVLVPWTLVATSRVPDAVWNPHTQQLTTLPGASQPDQALLIGGCDPFLPWLQNLFEARMPQRHLIPIRLSSQEALNAWSQHLIHVAGTHLFDPITGQYNKKSSASARSGYRIPYLVWEEGLISHPRADVIKKLAIREPGSEAYALYVRHQAHIDLPPEVFYSHQSVIDIVTHRPDWVGVSLGSLAATAGLQFEPWAEEAYDLWFDQKDIDSSWALCLREIMISPALRQTLNSIPYLMIQPGQTPVV